MKKLLWLNATLLLGTSGALTWLFIMTAINGQILFGEPSKAILYAELIIVLLCFCLALMALFYLVKGVKK